jgi:hypothetical protein
VTGTNEKAMRVPRPISVCEDVGIVYTAYTWESGDLMCMDVGEKEE